MQDLFKEKYITGTELEHFYPFFKLDFASLSKFELLGVILSNIYLSDNQRNELLQRFCNAQMLVHAVYRLQSGWRYKRAKIYNTEDLYMNPIQPGDKNTFVLVQNNMKYMFRIQELMSSIHTSLSHCVHFFPDPIVCKNPHTNIPLKKSDLYNIYFAIRETDYMMPVLFHNYFLSNFHFNQFVRMNQHIINGEYLNTYVENNCFEKIIEYVRDMFETYDLKCRIHESFPKDKLFTVMKPYLKLYFISNFSNSEITKRRAMRILEKKLHKFVAYNSHFGKRKVKLTSVNPFQNIKKCEYYYDEKHVPFFEKYKENFMTSHLDEHEEMVPMNTITIEWEPSNELVQQLQEVIEADDDTAVLNEDDNDDDDDDYNNDENYNNDNDNEPIFVDSDDDYE